MYLDARLPTYMYPERKKGREAGERKERKKGEKTR